MQHPNLGDLVYWTFVENASLSPVSGIIGGDKANKRGRERSPWRWSGIGVMIPLHRRFREEESWRGENGGWSDRGRTWMYKEYELWPSRPSRLRRGWSIFYSFFSTLFFILLSHPFHRRQLVRPLVDETLTGESTFYVRWGISFRVRCCVFYDAEKLCKKSPKCWSWSQTYTPYIYIYVYMDLMFDRTYPQLHTQRHTSRFLCMYLCIYLYIHICYIH